MAVTKLRLGKIYTGVPGVYTDIDRTRMGNLSPIAEGIVALVGDCEGGGQGGGAAIQEVASVGALKNLVRAGDLLEAGMMAFDPSLDDEVGGAVRLLLVKTNPAVAGSVMMANADGNALLVSASDYGLFTNQVNVQKAESGALPAAEIEFDVAFEDDVETYDDVGGSGWVSIAYANLAGLGYTSMGASVGVDASLNPDKVTCSGAKDCLTGGATAVTFTAGDRFAAASGAGNAGFTLTVYGVNSDGAPDSESVVLSGAGAHVPGATNKHWQYLTGAKLSSLVAGANLLLQDEGAATDLTMLIGQSSIGLYSETNTTQNLGNLPVADRPVSVASSGASTEDVVLRGLDPSGGVQTEIITLAGVVAVPSIKSWSKITQIEVGRLLIAQDLTLGPAGAQVVAIDARKTTTAAGSTRTGLTGTYTAAFTVGDLARLVSAQAADVGIAVTIYGLDTSGDYQTEVVTTDAANGTTPVFGAASWSKIFYAESASYATGALTVSDETGPTVAQTIAINRLTSGLLVGPTAGYYDLDLPVASTTVTVIADGATVRQVLLVGLDTAGAVQRELVTLTGAVAVPSIGSWTRVDGVYTGDLEAARDLSVFAAYIIQGGITTMQQLTDWLDARDGFDGTLVSTAPNTDLIADLDIPTLVTYGGAQPLDVLNLTKTLYAKLEELIRAVNAQSRYVTLSRPDGSTGVPTDTAAPVYLVGGSEGCTTNADWIAGLARLNLTELPQTIWVGSESATVHALLKAHLDNRGRALKREADGKMGLATMQTKAQITTAIQAMNDRDSQMFAQDIQRLDSNGVVTWFSPMFQAVLFAGMEAGATPGVPMTKKYANVLDVRQHASWNPVDDAETMLDRGLCYLREKSGIGWYWERGITTYLEGAELSSIEASSNAALNLFVRELRDGLDARIGGINFDGSLNAVRGELYQLLGDAVANRRIVDYRNVALTLTGDQIEIQLEVAAVVPTNFIPITIGLYVYEAAA